MSIKGEDTFVFSIYCESIKIEFITKSTVYIYIYTVVLPIKKNYMAPTKQFGC